MKKTITTNSEEETFAAAEELGRKVKKGDVIALYGELGTGKTIFVKGIARGLGIDEVITSPTFTLLEIYPGSLPLYHFDLYRIESEREFEKLGFEEYWDGEGVSVIEWADRAQSLLPENSITIKIKYLNSTQRKITIEYPCH